MTPQSGDGSSQGMSISVIYGDRRPSSPSGNYEFVNPRTGNDTNQDQGTMNIPRWYSSHGAAEEDSSEPRFNIDGSRHEPVKFEEFRADLSFGPSRQITTTSGRRRSEYPVKMTTTATRSASAISPATRSQQATSTATRATSTRNRGVTETAPPTIWRKCPEYVTLIPTTMTGRRDVKATDQNRTRIRAFDLTFPDSHVPTGQGGASAGQSTGNGRPDLTGFDSSLVKPIRECSYFAVGDNGSSWKENHVSVKLNGTHQYTDGRIMVSLTITRQPPAAYSTRTGQIVYDGPAELLKNCTHYMSSLSPNPVVVRRDSAGITERDGAGTEWEKVACTITTKRFPPSTQASSGVRRGR